MKNTAKKIIAIGSGVCFLALYFVFLLFLTKPHTEKIIIWLPDNYELENTLQNEVVSIMPTPIDNSHQSNKVFYSQIGMESFKRLFGNSERGVSVKIEDAGYFGGSHYHIIYQTKYDCADKNFIVAAQEYHRYNKKTLSEMRIRDRELFLKNKRNTELMYFLLILGLIGTVAVVGTTLFLLDVYPK